jgi:hypothetical protein
MNLIQERLQGLHLGAATRAGNLSLFPLFGETVAGADYLTLDEALAAGLAHVTEVSDAGSVPELAFDNGGPRDILLLDGEELVGARQNRVLNLSILVAGGQKVVIPVSCVERGRWAWRSRSFAASGRRLHARAHAAKMAQVSESLRAAGNRRSDQGEIWNHIHELSCDLDADSPTEAMGDLFEARRERLARYTRAFGAHPTQVGAVFAIDGAVRGLELFDSAAAFDKLLSKLVGSYAVDALASAAPLEAAPDADAARRFLDEVAQAPARGFPALGRGEDLRLQSASLAGGALVVDGRIVHLEAGRLAEEAPRQREWDFA